MPRAVRRSALIRPVTATKGTNYYVSPSGLDTNSGLSVALALKTIPAAHDKTNPGDTVWIMNGTYGGGDYTGIVLTRSGTAAAPITYAAYPGHAPVVLGSGLGTWHAIQCMANYIVLRGLIAKGDNANLTLSGAQASYNSYYASGARSGTDWDTYAKYNCNGISVGNFGDTVKPHHVWIYDCTAYDFPAAGIGADWADYITIEGCTSYNNSIYTMYATSGISIYEAWSADSFTGYRNFIRRNRSYNNFAQIPWADGGGTLSDGNGIIIDDLRGTQNTIPAYAGKTLVENNLCYNNGGAGINAYASPTVDVINNTLYRNGTVVGYADIMMNETTGSNMINNIVSARSAATKANDQTNATGLTRTNNTLFGSTVQATGTNELTSDPLFTNAAAGDFTLQAGSPCLNSGSNTLAPQMDINRKGRAPGGIDRGCFEA